MAESSVPKSTLESTPTGNISRRSVLKAAAGAVVGFASQGLKPDVRANPDLPPAVLTPDVTGQIAKGRREIREVFLREDVEERRGVRLVRIRRGYKELGIPFDKNNEEEIRRPYPKEWSSRKIKLIDEMLGHLPEHLYRPVPDKKRLRIALSNLGNKYHGSLGIFWRTPRDVIMLNDTDFSPRDKKRAFFLITHELIHREQRLLEGTTLAQIEELFGRPFVEVADEALKKLEELRPNDLEFFEVKGALISVLRNTSDPNKPADAPTESPLEFEARLCEFYVQGEDYFIHNVSRVFGHDMARKLFKHIRYSLFNVERYDALPNFEEKNRYRPKT